MTDLRQLEEDRMLRDTAKSMVTAGVERLRGDVEEQGLGKRAIVRVREGAEGLTDDAGDFVRENPGRVGSLAALGLVLGVMYAFRDTIADLVGHVLNADDLEEGASNREELESAADPAQNETD